MNRRLILCAAVLSILIPSLSFAQNNYATPRAVGLDTIVRKSFPKYYVRPYPGAIRQQLYPDGFYPVGWSRDGKLAYYIEPVDEACGCYFGELIIQDLRTDKVLWHFKNDPQERVDAQGAPIDDDLRKLWKRNEKVFTQKLREHNIQPVARFALMPATFRSAGKAYTAKVVVVKANDDDGLNRLRRVTLELHSPTLGKKSLFTSAYKGDEMWVSPLDAAVAGVLKSPFENRVAVVMIKVQRGYEGPPHTVEAQIVGADLVTGFRKF